MTPVQAAADVIREAATHHQGKLITRKTVEEMTGGALAAGTLANLDSRGLGIPGRFKVGKTVCYPIELVVDWLIGRIN